MHLVGKAGWTVLPLSYLEPESLYVFKNKEKNLFVCRHAFSLQILEVIFMRVLEGEMF